MTGWFPLFVPNRSWQTLRVGAGGWIRNVSISSDDTLIIKTDTYGGHVWDPTLVKPGPQGGFGMWRQIAAVGSFAANDPATDRLTNFGFNGSGHGGVYECAVSWSNSNIMYILYVGRLYKSIDKGKTWVLQTNFTPVTYVEMPSNDGYANCGNKMAIDPINPNRVIFSTGGPTGVLYKTLDGGTTVTVISTASVPAAIGGGYAIAYDPRVSQQSGGNSQTVYVFSYGNGLYKSTDGGATWTIQNSAGMPTQMIRMIVDTQGILWVTRNGGNNQNLYKYSGSTWTNMTTGGLGTLLHSIAIDPTVANAQRIVCMEQDANIHTYNISLDGGTTWNQSIAHATLVANDIPWLATNEPALAVGNQVFDSTGNIVFAEGIGVWRYNPPNDTTAAYNITSQSAGIEQLITNQIVSPPGGYPVVASWDRAAFTIVDPKVYRSVYWPGQAGIDGGTEIVHCWGVDYATSDPTFICGRTSGSGTNRGDFYSTDKGLTWTPFTNTSPTLRNGGGMAAASNLNQLIFQANQGFPYYTLDRGATAWHQCVLPGQPGSTSSSTSITPQIAGATGSNTIGSSGTKTFTVSAGLSITNGTTWKADAGGGNTITGTVTYSGTTLTMTASASTGAGTFASWTLSITGGNLTFVIPTGLFYPVGLTMIVNDNTNSAFFNGTCVSYDSVTTGNLVLSVTGYAGFTGTSTTWDEVRPLYTGGANAYYDPVNYHCADKDPSSPNTFYIFLNSNAYRPGIYRTIDGGVTWTFRSNPVASNQGVYWQLRPVPGKAGNLFLTGGLNTLEPFPEYPMVRTTDGGLTWTTVAGVTDAWCVGFGVNPGQAYPAVGFYGYYSGVLGFWVSKDNCATWTSISSGDTLAGSFDNPVWCTGDANTADTWYVGFHSSGSVYYGT